MSALPTRRDEAWRYSDIDAVRSLWPVSAPECIVVAAGETMRLDRIVDGTTEIAAFEIVLEQGASATLNVLNIARRYGRIAIEATLGEGAAFVLNGAQIGGGDTTLEIVTTVTHAEPGATSRQTVRSILGGTATGTYLGKLAVARGAVQTDSEQAIRAMLLDRGATANAKPELEIHADDVKCAHGCAIGELDRDALFYLASRGLPPKIAQTVLLRAFVAAVLEGADASLQDAAMRALEELA